MPPEVVNSVCSVMARLAFDLALWSEGKLNLLVVCEEAHRYMPADPRLGFAPTRHALARIAKEGRKYGCYLGVVTQRPGELDPTVLSQCSTVFAMRLANDQDQAIIRSAIADSSASMLSFLSAMGPARGHRIRRRCGDHHAHEVRSPAATCPAGRPGHRKAEGLEPRGDRPGSGPCLDRQSPARYRAHGARAGGDTSRYRRPCPRRHTGWRPGVCPTAHSRPRRIGGRPHLRPPPMKHPASAAMQARRPTHGASSEPADGRTPVHSERRPESPCL